MSILYFNSASMYPKFLKWKAGNNAILVDTDQGPVLIDTGIGMHDHVSPTRLVKFFRFLFGIPCAPDETACHQLERMGIEPQEVRNIILTHLHFDHAGGIADFPWATIHVHKREYEAMMKPRKLMEVFAYDKADFAHHPNWVTYENCTEKWFEFDAIPLPFKPKMYLVPLFGHTSGHCGVAVQDGEHWVFQTGDAMPANADYDITPMSLNRLVLGNHIPRIRKFAQQHPEVRIVAGHTVQKMEEKAKDSRGGK